MAKWTNEQSLAITTRGCNLLISAAAGAGKTAVLVERIIRLLCDECEPVDIDRLLVVTFTEAAAAEMRERIGAALEREIRDAGRSELTRQLSLVNGAPISTLHSFCLDVIRRYFYLLDIDPSLRVADATEAAMLQQDILDDVLEEALSAEDPVVHELAARYGGKRGDEGLGRQILRLYRFAWSNPNPERWLAGAVSSFDATGKTADTLLAPWLQPLQTHLRLTLDYASSVLARAQSLCRLPSGPLAYENVLQNDSEQINALALLSAASSWEQLREAWLGVNFERLPAARNVDDQIKEQVQNLRKKAKEAIGGAAEAFFARSAEEFRAEIGELAPLVAALAALTTRFAALYDKAKRQAGLLDFNDLEHTCLRILSHEENGTVVPSAAAVELRQRFHHVLVDEYQDINPVQDAILALVSRQGETTPNLFMVGDVKQSIYRFRLGEPALFLERYRQYPAEPGGPEQRILLSKNFRCRDGVVSAVNFLFRQLMTAEAAEIEYDRDAELLCGAMYPEAADVCVADAAVEVHLLPREQTDVPATEEPGGNETDDLDALEREGVVVAQRIREMLETPDGPLHVYDKETDCYRPACFRDIVILLRATSNRANRLVDILARYGIPAYADLSTGYFNATEVETMMALLMVVDNPCQDIPLAAVLRSPFVGLTLEELAAIRMAGGRDRDFYDAVTAAAAEGIPELSDKLQRFLDRLERWRSLARQEKLAAFIAAVYRESGYADYVAGLPDGAQRQANVRALFSRARQFDRFSRQGLFRFLEFIGQLRRSGEDLGAARALGENENVVRIMSIHKSKGLEFPVVFLCDLGKGFNFLDQRSDILIHRDLGIAPLIVDRQSGLRYPSLPYLALKIVGEAETRAEELRILYVALTRAREKLILVGSARGLDKEIEEWSQLLAHCRHVLPSADVARAGNYLDWIGRALIRHPDLQGDTNNYPWLSGEQARFRLVYWDGEGKKLPAVPLSGRGENTSAQMQGLGPLDVDIPAEQLSEIRRCLAYRYPYRLSSLPAKLSVSEIKRRFADAGEGGEEARLIPPQSWQRPTFLRPKTGLSPVERGILYHRVFQYLNLAAPLDEAGISTQLADLVKHGVLSAEEAFHIAPELLAPFFRSEAGQTVLAYNSQTYREWPFTLALPASRLSPGEAEDDVVIQGIIDLLVKTESGYVIVDFKSDRIPEGGAAELANRYKEQLRYYAMAVETILSGSVEAVYLYALAVGQTIPVQV